MALRQDPISSLLSLPTIHELTPPETETLRVVSSPLSNLLSKKTRSSVLFTEQPAKKVLRKELYHLLRVPSPRPIEFMRLLLGRPQHETPKTSRRIKRKHAAWIPRKTSCGDLWEHAAGTLHTCCGCPPNSLHAPLNTLLYSQNTPVVPTNIRWVPLKPLPGAPNPFRLPK